MINKSLHAIHIKMCTVTWNMACLSCCCHHCLTPTTSLCSHAPPGLQKRSESISRCHWLPFFPHGGIKGHTVASSTLLWQTPFCHAGPLLPRVTRQQNGTEYWWEGSASAAIPPPFTSDVVGQHNNIGGITFGAAIVNTERKTKRSLPAPRVSDPFHIS